MNRRASLLLLGALTGGVVLLAAGACGTDVDLGGGGDASGAEASAAEASTDAGADGGVDAEAFDCEPCATSAECLSTSVCASLDGGDGLCFARCDAGAGSCETDEKCGSVPAVAAGQVLSCVPTSGACPVPPAPVGPDGGALDLCGALVGPKVADAGCKACHYDCQKNGCYGGYYCNVSTKRCVRPPTTCP